MVQKEQNYKQDMYNHKKVNEKSSTLNLLKCLS